MEIKVSPMSNKTETSENIITNRDNINKSAASQAIGVQIKRILYNYTQSATTHGIGNMARSQHIALFIIWAVCILASIAYCIYLITAQIITFTQYGVISSNVIINEVPTLFPAVDICNLNPYDGEYASNMINKSSKIVVPLIGYNSAIIDLETMNTFIQNEMKLNNLWDVYQSGFWLNQMIVSCRFQGEECDLERDFFYYRDFNYGNCYRFNAGKSLNEPNGTEMQQPIKMIKRSGSDYGLQLELFAGDIKKQQQYAYKNGFRIVVHNQSVVSFPKDDGIDVSTGLQTNIAISRTFIDKLDSPYSNCIDKLDNKAAAKNPILNIMINEYNQTVYNQKFCLKVCTQQHIFNICQCQDIRYPFINNTSKRVCGFDQIECASDAESSFYDGEAVMTCYDYCQIECKRTIYETKVSVASYPTDWYTSRLANSISFKNVLEQNSLEGSEITLEYLQETALMVNVYYNDMRYMYISETPALTIESMVAFIGGNMGLCVGMSVLSFMEIVQLIFHAVYFLWEHFRNKKERSEQKRTDELQVKSSL